MRSLRLTIYILILVFAGAFHKGSVFRPTNNPYVDKIDMYATLEKNAAIYAIGAVCILAFIFEASSSLIAIALKGYREGRDNFKISQK